MMKSCSNNKRDDGDKSRMPWVWICISGVLGSGYIASNDELGVLMVRRCISSKKAVRPGVFASYDELEVMRSGYAFRLIILHERGLTLVRKIVSHPSICSSECWGWFPLLDVLLQQQTQLDSPIITTNHKLVLDSELLLQFQNFLLQAKSLSQICLTQPVMRS